LPTISTFGFGYDLDSNQLVRIAQDGNGSYAFIPDAGLLGSVFANAVSNLSVMMAKDVELTLEAQNGATLSGDEPIFGGHPAVGTPSAQKATVNLGSVHFGQPLRVVAIMQVPEEAMAAGYLKATLKYAHRGTDKEGPESEYVTKEVIGIGGEAVEMDVEPEKLRLQSVDCLRMAIEAAQLTDADRKAGKTLDLTDARETVETVIGWIDESPCKDAQAIVALKDDLTGQVMEALSRPDWFERWGQHYLPSLLFAHLKQQCNNFKDAGVQEYGGALFTELREAADQIFINMPPPVATIVAPPTPTMAANSTPPPTASGYSSRIEIAPIGPETTYRAPSPRAPAVDMSRYYYSGGG